MDKRFIQFFLTVMIIYMVFLLMMPRPVPREEEGGGTQETAAEVMAPEGEDSSAVSAFRAEERAISSEEQIPYQEAERIEVITDTYSVIFSTLGARPVSWEITDPRYTGATEKENDKTVELIPQFAPEDPLREYPTEIAFTEHRRERFKAFNMMVYTSEVREEEEKTVIRFESPLYKGIKVSKVFEIPRKGFLNTLTVEILNGTTTTIPIEGEGPYGEGVGLVASWGGGFLEIEDKQEAGIENRYMKNLFLIDGSIRGKKPKRGSPQEFKGEIDWAGIESNYYVALLVPESFQGTYVRSLVRSRNEYDTVINGENVKRTYGSIEIGGPSFTLSPGTVERFSYMLFVGPKHKDALVQGGHDLEKIVFHSIVFVPAIFRPLCLGLLGCLRWLETLAGNYGMAIILLTVLVRLVTHPLTHKGIKLQAKTMEEQAKIRPYMEEINKKYKDNPQKKNQETMKLYKEHGINPLGFMRGCLPMLLQIPIFFALYYVLLQSIDLKGQSFLWIADLSKPDALYTFKNFSLPLMGPHLNLLPILMAASQIVVSKFTMPQTGDAMQKQMMYFMPVFLLVILYNFSSGLILYWLVSNVWQSAHQIIAKRMIAKEKPA